MKGAYITLIILQLYINDVQYSNVVVCSPKLGPFAARFVDRYVLDLNFITSNIYTAYM